jgi:hypothetical protein
MESFGVKIDLCVLANLIDEFNILLSLAWRRIGAVAVMIIDDQHFQAPGLVHLMEKSILKTNSVAECSIVLILLMHSL